MSTYEKKWTVSKRRVNQAAVTAILVIAALWVATFTFSPFFAGPATIFTVLTALLWKGYAALHARARRLTRSS